MATWWLIDPAELPANSQHQSPDRWQKEPSAMIPAPCHQVTLISGFTHFWLELQPLLLTVYWERDWEEARDQRKDSPNFFLLLPHLSSVLWGKGQQKPSWGPLLFLCPSIFLCLFFYELPFLSFKIQFKSPPLPKRFPWALGILVICTS